MTRFRGYYSRGNRQPVYNNGVTLALLSDLHLQDVAADIDPSMDNRAKMLTDLEHMIGRDSIQAWVISGDVTANAYDSDFTAMVSWVERMNTTGLPLAIIPGNHDELLATMPGDPLQIDPARWTSRTAPLGVVNRSYFVDVGDHVRIVGLALTTNRAVGTVGYDFRCTVDAETLTWADSVISGTDRQVVVTFHAPLYGTVGENPPVYSGSSYYPFWYAHSQDAYTFEDMLAKHSNIVAYVSGHTHSAPDRVDVVKRMTLGNATFAAISASSPIVLNSDGDVNVCSALLTIFPDRVEVRYRNHGTGQWLNPVHTVAL